MIRCIKGDITKLHVDAVVNAANCTLLGGGGVDGAIHRAAGQALLKECMTLGGCATGYAKVTEGYNLPAKAIIHTVGPVFRTERQAECKKYLSMCYASCLDRAYERHFSSIAFPNISTGAYGFPKAEACKVALCTVRSWLKAHADAEMEVIFVCYDESNFVLYEKMINKKS